MPRSVLARAPDEWPIFLTQHKMLSCKTSPRICALTNANVIMLNNRDGDVRIGTEQELLAGQTTLKARAHSLHPDVNDNAFGQELWPEAKVLYAYKDQATKNKVQASVNAAIKQWNMYADHINFVDQGFDSADKLGVLTITANAGGGCYSSIGYHKDTWMYMNLITYSDTVCSSGATTHEFGHAIGKTQAPKSPISKSTHSLILL